MATEVRTTPVVAAPEIRTRRTRRARPAPEGGRINWGLTIIVAIVSLIIILPLYFAIAMALKSPAQTGTGSGFNFPWPIQWGNFRAAWDLTDTPLAASMSLLITVIAVIGEILVSALAAWAKLGPLAVPRDVRLPDDRPVHPVPRRRAAAGQAHGRDWPG
jgi:raffinose/stachyose/melibiose transport system permease protein